MKEEHFGSLSEGMPFAAGLYERLGFPVPRVQGVCLLEGAWRVTDRGAWGADAVRAVLPELGVAGTAYLCITRGPGEGRVFEYYRLWRGVGLEHDIGLLKPLSEIEILDEGVGRRRVLYGGVAEIGEGSLPAACAIAERERFSSFLYFTSNLGRSPLANLDKTLPLLVGGGRPARDSRPFGSFELIYGMMLEGDCVAYFGMDVDDLFICFAKKSAV